MAGYREHISVSGLLGVAYAVGATFAYGFTPVQAALAGVLTWVAGMLPDLDSESGRPVREIFGLIAAVTGFVMMRHLLHWGGDVETALLLAVVLYAAIKYGAAMLLGRLAVHRGMFHSLPALLIAAEAVFLGYKSDSVSVKLLMAGGVALGFLSHLVLDELYSVELSGVRLRLNKAAGSAFKLLGKSVLPNLITYSLLAALTYTLLVDIGILDEPTVNGVSPLLREAVEKTPNRR